MDVPAITTREREVLDLLGEHLTHEQIGARLFISVRTVESHVAALRRKLDMPDHRSLVRYAVEHRVADGTDAVEPPVPLTTFVGRAAELAELDELLGTSRLVSSIGPGGAGKTRLAIEAARNAASSCGVCWVDLVSVTDAAQLPDAIARACGARVTSRLDAIAATAVALRNVDTLLVLDNCEHLVNAVAVAVDRLLASCPRLTVLVTSRVRLGLAGERVMRVEGLGSDVDGDAVQLFVERAVAAGAPVPSDAERRRMSVVCTALGGLALAIELAAVRLPSIGLEGVELGVLDSAHRLVGGARHETRHRSMHETLEWSVALLDPVAAVVLRRGAVLVSPFDVRSAQDVVAFGDVTTADVRSALGQLVDHSLLSASTDEDGVLRHRMLEPIRQYGLACLESIDQPVFDAHREWCSTALAALPDAQAVRRIAADARAALARAATSADAHPAAAGLARAFAVALFRDGSLGEAELRFEQAAALETDGSAAAADLARAAAVAKCLVAGKDALRYELAAAERAEAAGDAVGAALALARAAELVNRFPGMFGAAEIRPAEPFLERATRLAGDERRVRAAIVVATAGYAGTPAPGDARRALDAAREVRDVVLESSALDAVISASLIGGDIVEAHRVAQSRVARLTHAPEEPATALELKDALHVASFCACGAGQLDIARDMARRQRQMTILRERADLADDETFAPAVLAGDWDDLLPAAARFLADWTEAGRPVAAGRGPAPAAIALAHGLLGDDDGRATWLEVLARIRGVPSVQAQRDTGYGELFEAIHLLHRDEPYSALDALRAEPRRSLYSHVYAQWSAACAAEAAVLCGAADAGELLRAAVQRCDGNPIASSITRRAEALRAGDQAVLRAVADEFERAGSTYQRDRTLALVGRR